MDDSNPKETRKSMPRGIFLLPNLFTTSALFSGFFAMVAAVNGDFTTASIAIFIAMVLDGLDGRVARLTNTQSDFGAEYDSLSDMLSFGVAPCLVAFIWILQDIGKTGWVKIVDYKLTDEEQAAFNKSADAVRAMNAVLGTL